MATRNGSEKTTLRKAEVETLVKSTHLYAQTILNVRQTSFDWRIDKFSTLQPGVRRKFKNDLIEFDLVLNICKNLSIDLISVNNTTQYFSCNTSITVLEGEKESCGINKYYIGDLKIGVPTSLLNFSTQIFENKSQYLPNDVLFLDFDVVLSTVESFRPRISSVKGPKDDYEKYENTKVLINDLKSMFNDHILSDVELRTSTKTYPAHKNILSARSPVFKRMFSHDMKEKTSGRVDIVDLEDDTIHRMLLFVYTGFLEELQFESATKLYTAADKYEIMSLKNICSSFFKDSLSPTTACDVLLFADLHQDVDLKNAVHVYILEHDEIFRSLAWKDLMDFNIKLAADVMYRKLNPDAS